MEQPTAEPVLPNLVIAGVPKGGTTSLFQYLAQHPDVGASTKKELAYFEPLLYGEPMAPLEAYAREFTHCADARYRMEGTPNYFFGGRAMAVAMRDALPDCRVVISLREPVQRCWSWYRYVRSRARIPEDMDFGSYLDVCEQLHGTGEDDLRRNQPYTGLGGSVYADRLAGWLDVFGDRARIEYFDDLAADPRRCVEGILRWLGLDHAVASDFRYETENRTVGYRNRQVQMAAVRVNRWSERFFHRHRDLKRRLRTVYYRVNAVDQPELLSEADRERLTAFYAPHNRALAHVLRAAGRDQLPGWVADPGVRRPSAPGHGRGQPG
jgi:hypothetical protein